MGFLLRVVINTLAILLAVNVVPGIEARGVLAVLGAGLVLGLINAVVRPVLLILTLPLTLVTLGLVRLDILRTSAGSVDRRLLPYHRRWNLGSGFLFHEVVALCGGSDSKEGRYGDQGEDVPDGETSGPTGWPARLTPH